MTFISTDPVFIGYDMGIPGSLQFEKKHFYFLDDFLSELARVLGSMLTTQYSIL